MTQRVSVITVCLNSAATIERTIKSVLGQTYPDIEYIVVDGGSTDGTLNILDRYRDQIDRLISEPDHGVYDAMNKGIRSASGDWIHILNADDHYVGPDVLERAVRRLIPGRTNYFSILRECKGIVTDEHRFPYRHWKMYVSAKLPHPGLIVGREQYQEIGLYDAKLRIAADHDLILRMVKRYPPHFIDFPLVSMDQLGLSATNLGLSYREFMEVTIRHGLPAPIAWCIYWMKRLRWGIHSHERNDRGNRVRQEHSGDP